MKKVAVAIAILFTLNLQADYIIQQDYNGVLCAPLQNEYAPLYASLVRYTFPSNTNPLDLHPELSDDDIREMYRHEEVFLNKIMPENVTATFIPKTLFQLLVLKFWLERKLVIYDVVNNIMVAHAPLGVPDSPYFWRSVYTFLEQKKPVRDLLKMFSLIWKKDNPDDLPRRLQASFFVYQQLNLLKPIEQLHCIINAEIISYLKNSNIDIANFDEKAAQQVTKDLLMYFDYFYENEQFSFPGTFTEKFLAGKGIKVQDSALLASTISLEYQAHKDGTYTVYRSTNSWEGRNNRIDSTRTFRDSDVYPNTVSYGNTLFDGLFGFDCLGASAMPYDYMCGGQLSYAVSINKYAYAQQSLGNIFFVPPIHSLISMAGQGELFHTRSKVCLDARKLTCGIWWFSGYLYDIPAFLIVQDGRSAEGHEQQFSDYLVRNIEFLRNTTPISSVKFMQNQLKPVDFCSYHNIKFPVDPVSELNFPPPKQRVSYEHTD